jgi:putative transposase
MLSSRPVIGSSSAASSSESVAGGYYKHKKQPLSLTPTQMRRQWLTGLIREVHTASRQTYASRRVHAELTLGMGVKVSELLVAVLMSNAKIAGCRDLRK